MSKKMCAGITDYRDRDFTDTTNDPSTSYRIKAVYQGGHVDGHYLKFQADTLISTATYDEADIRIESAFPKETSKDFAFWVISDPQSPTKALKRKCDEQGSDHFTVENNTKIASLNTASDAKTELSDFLFKKFCVPGTANFYLTSYTKTADGKTLLLAVDANGKLRMDDPPHVDDSDQPSMDIAGDDKNLFTLVTIRT